LATSTYIVLSGVPEGLSNEQRDQWHAERVASLLELPGVVAAQRYRLTPLFEDPEFPYSYELGAIVDIEGDAEAQTSVATATDALAALQRTQSADLTSWTAIPLGARAITR
jgi:hypothetical protein